MLPQTLPIWEVNNPVSKVFVMDEIPPTAGSLAAGDSTVPNAYLVDTAIDTLLLMMETQGTYLYKTTAHPSGIIGSNDVVILKCSFQWDFRNTTSTDRIKGVIWRILQHPNGFTGEILVGDNTQWASIGEDDNNSEDTEQCILDVINTFHSKGYSVHLFRWADIMYNVVTEYSDGDYNDGYTYEPISKITYPKFQSPEGNYISLKYGIWDSISGTYDHNRLCIIDFPVLKCHGWTGATLAIKNWVGVLTVAYQDERFGGNGPMHFDYFFSPYALVAKVMQITFPKLTVIDGAWANPEGNYGNIAVQLNMLLGSTDPFAASWYAAKYMLTPVAYYPEQTNPDINGGYRSYGTFLTNMINCMQDSGFAVTKDSSEISVYDRSVLSVTSSHNLVDQQTPVLFKLHQNYPNPFNSQTQIIFDLYNSASIQLHIYDINGNLVKSLINSEMRDEGSFLVKWDGTNNQGQSLSSGVYFYKLIVGDLIETKSMILEK